MIRFLVDECLSPSLAEAARARGYDATHVVWLGRGSADDREVTRIALERDYIVVTNNARDFRRIYGRLEVHPGLVLVLPDLPGAQQRRYFLAIVEFIDARPDVVNRIVSIDRAGVITIEDWSANDR